MLTATGKERFMRAYSHIFAVILAALIFSHGLRGQGEEDVRTPNVSPHIAAQEPIKPKAFISGIPDVIQMNSFSCGVAVVQAVATYYGQWGYQEEYAGRLGTTQAEGTHPAAIVRVLRSLGLEAKMIEDMTLKGLKDYFDKGHIVIVDFQAWGSPEDGSYEGRWEDGHYGIVVGYNDSLIFIEDPSLLGTIGYLTHEGFLSRWHDYENEDGKRREYRHMAIVVRGTPMPQPQFSSIE